MVIDLTGQTFGRLTVINRVPKPAHLIHRDAHWQCQCQCGKLTVVRSSNLRNGNTKACGCFMLEGGGMVPPVQRKHGDASNGKPSKEYHAWQAMKTRCYNPKERGFKNYGGRGIAVCDRWLNSFENFLADMGRCPPGKTIDRYPNNNGNYEPGNCRWATRSENQNNRRNTVTLVIDDVERPLSEWAKATGQSRSTLHARRKRGLSDYEVVYGQSLSL